MARLNPEGSKLLYSTYLGGSIGDRAIALRLDRLGNAYIAGETRSADFPVTNGAFQPTNAAVAAGHLTGFVTKLDPEGSGLLYSTFLGGSAGESAYALALDGSDDLYVTGETYSTDFPITKGAYQPKNRAAANNGTNVFVTKLDLNPPPAPTTTTLTASVNPQTAGEAVTFTAKVAPESGTAIPTGSVVFSVDGSARPAVALGSTGKATYSTSALAAGTHTIKASYDGSSSFAPSSASLTETIKRPAPAATLTPSSLTFAGTVEGVSSPAEVVEVKNTGTATLTFTTGGISIAGAGASSFIKTTTCGSTLAAGATCTISVTFKPAATGTLTAALGVADNAAGSPQKVALSGAGEPKPAFSITLSPAAISFPNTVSGDTSESQVVTVKNSGRDTVTLKSIAIAGTNPKSFVEVNDCGASLASGAGCTVFIAFKPASAATLKAALSVADTATGSPQTVALSGTGTAAISVKLSTTALTFAATAKGATSEAKSVTLTNGGNSTLDITGITLTGLDPSSFAQLNTCGPALPPAANCVVYVSFRPAATGTLTASLSIADNGGASPQTVALKGTGN